MLESVIGGTAYSGTLAPKLPLECLRKVPAPKIGGTAYFWEWHCSAGPKIGGTAYFWAWHSGLLCGTVVPGLEKSKVACGPQKHEQCLCCSHEFESVLPFLRSGVDCR